MRTLCNESLAGREVTALIFFSRFAMDSRSIHMPPFQAIGIQALATLEIFHSLVNIRL